MAELTLHDHELDDQSYKVRFLLSVLGLPYTRRVVNMFPGHEHISPAYLKLSPRGTLPILVDGALVLADAEAILTYLARAHDPARTWLPDDPARFGEVQSWLAFSIRELSSASLARLHVMMEVPADGAAAVATARRAFRLMDDHMTRREFAGASWFVGDGPTLAEIALFSSIALSRDFSVDHDEYPALRRWMRKVRSIPGFITMPGIPDYH